MALEEAMKYVRRRLQDPENEDAALRRMVQGHEMLYISPSTALAEEDRPEMPTGSYFDRSYVDRSRI